MILSILDIKQYSVVSLCSAVCGFSHSAYHDAEKKIFRIYYFEFRHLSLHLACLRPPQYGVVLLIAYVLPFMPEVFLVRFVIIL